IDAMLGDIEAEQGHTMTGTEDELAPIGPTPPEIPETGLHVEPDGPAKLFDEAMKTEVPTEKITGARNINIERHHQGAAANRDRRLAALPAGDAVGQVGPGAQAGRARGAAG
ncbi:MAG: hypothetical protein GY814_11570, partial [Gammaproteobacteria bacterium]|nr:hypothetical protein [Gammaproteobacteria bacterium]